MRGNPAGRRAVLKTILAAVAGTFAARPRLPVVQQVRSSAGTEAPKRRGADRRRGLPSSRQISIDLRSTLWPGDASVKDYRSFQRRIRMSRKIIVQPSIYGTDNSCTPNTLVAFGPTARAVAVVRTESPTPN